MKIRQLETNDINDVVEIWYETSIAAHCFIASEYWQTNKEAMTTTYLPNSETYVAVEDDSIVGFVSMADNYLAAIFVQKNKQGLGIGKKLLEYVKQNRSVIELKVYKKNTDSINFYLKQGFKEVSEGIEEATNESEIFMKWER